MFIGSEKMRALAPSSEKMRALARIVALGAGSWARPRGSRCSGMDRVGSPDLGQISSCFGGAFWDASGRVKSIKSQQKIEPQIKKNSSAVSDCICLGFWLIFGQTL